MTVRLISIATHKILHSLVTSLCLLAPFFAYAGKAINDNAFGDPNYVVNMAPEWQSKAVTHDAKAGEADLVISLGQQTYPALHKFVEDFAASRNITIVIQQGTCGVSAKKLARKEIDVGAFCCPPGKTDRLPGVEFHTIGIASIALVTNPANEISDLSAMAARNIFSGRTMKWSEVPVTNEIKLPGSEITPVVRLHCKKRPGHWRHLLDNEDLFSPDIREVGVIPDMIKEVADNKAAIGFETLYMLEVYKDKGEVKALMIDGHDPADEQQLLSARYPLYRTYNLTSWADDKNAALANELIASIKQHIETEGSQYGIIPSSRLRTAGWKFYKDELVGEPDGTIIFNEHQ